MSASSNEPPDFFVRVLFIEIKSCRFVYQIIDNPPEHYLYI